MIWRKPELNAFAITFADPLPSGREPLINTAENTVTETVPPQEIGVLAPALFWVADQPLPSNTWTTK